MLNLEIVQGYSIGNMNTYLKGILLKLEDGIFFKVIVKV